MKNHRLQPRSATTATSTANATVILPQPLAIFFPCQFHCNTRKEKRTNLRLYRKEKRQWPSSISSHHREPPAAATTTPSATMSNRQRQQPCSFIPGNSLPLVSVSRFIFLHVECACFCKQGKIITRLLCMSRVTG